MFTRPDADTRTDEVSSTGLFEVISMFATGAGIITYALFPLAIPILALTIAFTIPLLLIGLAVGLAVGLVALIIAGPILLFRRIRRGRTGGSEPRSSPEAPVTRPGRRHRRDAPALAANQRQPLKP